MTPENSIPQTEQIIAEVSYPEYKFRMVFEYLTNDGSLRDRFDVLIQGEAEAHRSLSEVSYALNDRALSVIVANTVVMLAGLRRAYLLTKVDAQ